jgi:hypothetical protein
MVHRKVSNVARRYDCHAFSAAWSRTHDDDANASAAFVTLSPYCCSILRLPVRENPRLHCKIDITLSPHPAAVSFMSSHSLAAAKRLRKELQVLTTQGPDSDIHLQLANNADNLLLWKAWLRGPADTPYESGVFQLDIRCGTDYPLAPPSMVFLTKVGSVDYCVVVVDEVHRSARASVLQAFERETERISTTISSTTSTVFIL